MKLIRHSFHHIIIHLALFSGFALLVPAITQAVNEEVSPWTVAPTAFFAAVMLVVTSLVLLRQIKESMPELLQSFVKMLFLPGALSVVFSVLQAESLNVLSGYSVLSPAFEFYVYHSVPTVLSVAAVYMCIGGVTYWIGHKIENAQYRVETTKYKFGNV